MWRRRRNDGGAGATSLLGRRRTWWVAMGVVGVLVVAATAVLAFGEDNSRAQLTSVSDGTTTTVVAASSSTVGSTLAPSTTAALITPITAPATTSAPSTLGRATTVAPTTMISAPTAGSLIESRAGGHQAVQAALVAARSRWAIAKPGGGYTWRYAESCFCPPPHIYEADVDGAARVTAVRPVGATSPSTPISPATGRTVDFALSELQQAIDGDAAIINVRFDRALGYPSSYYIDMDRRIADEEHGLTVSAFTGRA